MGTKGVHGGSAISRGYTRLLLVASIITYLLIVMGGVVCMTGSGQGCPDWPRCYGQVIPPAQLGAIIEMTHRLLAALTAPLIIIAAVWGWRKYGAIRWVSWPATLAVGFVFAVVVFGAFAVLTGLSPAVATIDVGSALMVLAFVLTAWTVAAARLDNPALPDRLSFRAPFAKLALGTLCAVYVVLVSGVLVADVGSLARCLGWPHYGMGIQAREVPGSFPLARRVLGGLAGILILTTMLRAWHAQEARTLRAATYAAVLFLAEMAIEILIQALGFSMILGALYVMAAVGIFAFLIVVTVRVGIETKPLAVGHSTLAKSD
jgi:heme A synthase